MWWQDSAGQWHSGPRGVPPDGETGGGIVLIPGFGNVDDIPSFDPTESKTDSQLPGELMQAGADRERQGRLLAPNSVEWDKNLIHAVLTAYQIALGDGRISIAAAQDDPVLAEAIIYAMRGSMGDVGSAYKVADWLNVKHVQLTRGQGEFVDQVYLNAQNLQILIDYNQSKSLTGFDKGMIAGGAEAFGNALTGVALGMGSARPVGEVSLRPTAGGGPRVIVVDASKYPVSAANLEEAGAVGVPLTVNRAGAAANRAAALKGIKKVPGMDLDEAPPAMLRLPGATVIVRPTPPGDNRGAGASIGNQARPVPNGGQVIIIIRR
jgi:hypothetical protein